MQSGGERCYTDNYLSTIINQSFSPENFRTIFDYENRRGVYLEGRFFPEIAKLTDEIKAGVSWALLKKTNVKEHLDRSNSTFAGEFDRLMRCVNYGETNGIVIGPEFSRIFAELILQSVDRAVLLELPNGSPTCVHERDYEIFRYVDDYFVFYNDEKIKDAIVRELQLTLKKYKLYLNNSKAVSFGKPIITDISIAKQRIGQLLNEELAYKITQPQTVKPDGQTGDGKEPQKTGSIRISPKDLIIRFKTIIKESRVEYRETLNYALLIIEKRCLDIVKEYRSIAKTGDSERQLGNAILAICEFTFFIYSVSPRANTTLRLCRVLQVFTSFLKGSGANGDLKHSVFKRIFDDISLTLDKNPNPNHTPVETLYLLVALAELGKDYWLDVDALASYVGIETAAGGSFQSKSPLNYISLVVLLFYMKNKKRYDRLRDFLEITILEKFRQKQNTLPKDTELTLLLFDTLACPYIKVRYKKRDSEDLWNQRRRKAARDHRKEAVLVHEVDGS